MGASASGAAFRPVIALLLVVVVPVSVVSSCLRLAGRVGMWLKMAPIGFFWLFLPFQATRVSGDALVCAWRLGVKWHFLPDLAVSGRFWPFLAISANFGPIRPIPAFCGRLCHFRPLVYQATHWFVLGVLA